MLTGIGGTEVVRPLPVHLHRITWKTNIGFRIGLLFIIFSSCIKHEINKLLVKEIQLLLNYITMKDCSNDQILFSDTYNLFTLFLLQ